MANIDRLAPIIFRWEGGFANDPNDRGGATNMGVTVATWRQVGYDKDGDGDIDADDVRLLTRADATRVLRIYWDRWRADSIRNQSVANILVDWVWGSGRWGIVIPQRILGVAQDGIVGVNTITALNAADQRDFFNKVFAARKKFFDDIVAKNPSQRKFHNGWMNRLNSFKFEA